MPICKPGTSGYFGRRRDGFGEDIESQDSDAGEPAEDGTVEGTPGEAVLTSAQAGNIVAEAKVTREQVRAQNKESLLEIIDNEHLSDEQKQDAVSQMVAMTDYAKKKRRQKPFLLPKDLQMPS